LPYVYLNASRILWTYFPTFVDLFSNRGRFFRGRFFHGPFFRIPITTSGFKFIRGLLLSGRYVDEIHFTTTLVVWCCIIMCRLWNSPFQHK